MTTSSRWRFRVVVLALVLGAVTNVLVAAWCAYAVSTQMSWVYSGYWSDGTRDFGVSLQGRPGKAIVNWHLPSEMETAYAMWKGMGKSPFQPEPPAGERPPRWATVGDEGTVRWLGEHPPLIGRAPDSIECSLRCDIAYGWPLLSFRGGLKSYATLAQTEWIVEHDYGPELPAIVTPMGGFMASGVPLAGMSEPREMPLTPIVTGVVGNTAVYGAAWWVVLVAPGAGRRWRRRRRRACVWCGYDRRGIAADALCPECGR